MPLDQELNVKIKVVEELSTKVASMIGSLEKLTSESKKTTSSIDSGFNKVAGLIGLNLSIQGLAATIKGFASSTLQWAENIRNMTQQTGLSADELQTLDFAARKSGASMEELTVGIAQFNRSLAEVRNGNKEVISSFEVMGLDIRRLIADGKSGSEILAILGDTLKTTGREGRDAFSEIVGPRAALKLIPTITQDLKKMQEELRASGDLVNEETLERFNRMDEQLKTLEFRFKNALRNMTAASLSAGDGIFSIGVALKDLGVVVKDEDEEKKKLDGQHKIRLSELREKIKEVGEEYKDSTSGQLDSLKKLLAQENLIAVVKEELITKIRNLERDYAKEQVKESKERLDKENQLVDKLKDNEEKLTDIKSDAAERRSDIDKEETEFYFEQGKEKTEFAEQQEAERTRIAEDFAEKRKDVEKDLNKSLKELDDKAREDNTADIKASDKKVEDEIKEKTALRGRLAGKTEAETQEWIKRLRDKSDEELQKRIDERAGNLQGAKDAIRVKAQAELDELKRQEQEKWDKLAKIQLDAQKKKNGELLAEEKKFLDKMAELKEKTDERIVKSIKTIEDAIDELNLKMAALNASGSGLGAFAGPGGSLKVTILNPGGSNQPPLNPSDPDRDSIFNDPPPHYSAVNGWGMI